MPELLLEVAGQQVITRLRLIDLEMMEESLGESRLKAPDLLVQIVVAYYGAERRDQAASLDEIKAWHKANDVIQLDIRKPPDPTWPGR